LANITGKIKSRKVTWVGDGRVEMHTQFWSGDIEVQHHLEDLGIDGRIILKWIVKE
jgi:hypothetical protein